MSAPVPQQWRDNLMAELSAAGLPDAEIRTLTDDALAEADDAGNDPASLFGPAVTFARELAAASRGSQPARIRDRVATTSPAESEVVLRLEGVSVRRGRRRVLDGLDLELRRGQVLAVVGANGSGKTTLLEVCAGQLRPERGTVQRTRSVGHAPQQNALAPALTVDEHLMMFGAARDIGPERAIATGHHLLAQLGWRSSGRELVGALSGGTQQKLNVVLAQLDRPDLLLLDEPYQGFDQNTYVDLWELIGGWRDAGTAVLLVTHLLRDLDQVDQVLELPAPVEVSR